MPGKLKGVGVFGCGTITHQGKPDGGEISRDQSVKCHECQGLNGLDLLQRAVGGATYRLSKGKFLPDARHCAKFWICALARCPWPLSVCMLGTRNDPTKA